MCMHFRILLGSRKNSTHKDIALVVHLYEGIGENSQCNVDRLVLSWFAKKEWDTHRDIKTRFYEKTRDQRIGQERRAHISIAFLGTLYEGIGVQNLNTAYLKVCMHFWIWSADGQERYCSHINQNTILQNTISENEHGMVAKEYSSIKDDVHALLNPAQRIGQEWST